ncbi:hypothetical protein, partial [Enterococcus faecium]|uniref:hypothetical protein n=1 Tax=Enterococcus faecium TaxID=1352 RepID=UPI003F425991
RMYALDAVGNADRSTNVRWAYPAINQPTIGSIWTTPAIAFNNIYFGTRQPTADDSTARMYSLNADTGAFQQAWPKL